MKTLIEAQNNYHDLFNNQMSGPNIPVLVTALRLMSFFFQGLNTYCLQQ